MGVVPDFMLELVQVVPEVVVLELELELELVLVQVVLDLVQEVPDSTTLLRTTLLRSSEALAADTMPLQIAEEDLLNPAPVRANRTYVRIGVYDLSIQPNEISKAFHKPLQSIGQI